MGVLRSAWLIAAKDLRVEWRSRELAYTTLFFAVTAVLIFAFSFVQEDGTVPPGAGSGILWVTLTFSGTIALKSDITITNGRLTIAGQTAPGDGITIRDRSLNIAANDVVVRYIRARLGAASGTQQDAISVTKGRRIILDHVSASWSIDETLSASTHYDKPGDGVWDLTVQWSIIADSLTKSLHAKGAHGYGSLVRGGRIVTCGATSGDQPGADLRRVFIRQLQIYGSTLGNLSELQDLLAFCSQHGVRPLNDSRYPMAQAHAALDRLASGQQFGKVAVSLV